MHVRALVARTVPFISRFRPFFCILCVNRLRGRSLIAHSVHGNQPSSRRTGGKCGIAAPVFLDTILW